MEGLHAKHRLWVTPDRRGKGSWKVATDQDEETPAQRHVAIASFCSCKTVVTCLIRLKVAGFALLFVLSGNRGVREFRVSADSHDREPRAG